MTIQFRCACALALLAGAALSACKARTDGAAAPAAPAAATAAPAAPASAAPAKAAPAGFDVASVPESRATLPPFPFLDWPRDLAASDTTREQSDFSQSWVLAGASLRSLEGRLEQRQFYNGDAKLSGLASRRNYAAAVQALGGVKVNAVEPDNPALVQANADNFAIDKLGMVEPQLSYDAYLVRAPDRLIWITVRTNEARTYLTVVEEKTMEQKVAFVKADAMRAELDRTGRVALYINFDTDKAVLRADARPAVDEITELLKRDPALKLSVEGHTDNSGDAQRNNVLSQERAAAVVATLLASGIDKARVSAAGLGAAKPLADNASEAGRAKNRRVELVKLAR
ncbi:MAG: OmpA family protein [Pseudomonadota bacterium]